MKRKICNTSPRGRIRPLTQRLKLKQAKILCNRLIWRYGTWPPQR